MRKLLIASVPRKISAKAPTIANIIHKKTGNGIFHL
jgi:hypothetical protein